MIRKETLLTQSEINDTRIIRKNKERKREIVGSPTPKMRKELFSRYGKMFINILMLKNARVLKTTSKGQSKIGHPAKYYIT